MAHVVLEGAHRDPYEPEPRILAMFIACFLTALIAAPSDGVFSDLSHVDALAAAASDEHLLLISFSTGWSSACERMDQTTWADWIVVAWVAEEAVAIQIDVGEENVVASSYHVDSVPTTVVLRDGEEIDRVVGYQDTDGLLTWLEGVLEGRTREARLRAELEQLRGAGETDVMARYQLAKALVARGLDDEASGHYRWLWEHALQHNLAFYGVRMSFMAHDIEELAVRHQPTLAAFGEFFDRELEAVDGGYGHSITWSNWITLGAIAQRQDDMVLWIVDSREANGTLPQVPSQVRTHLADLLVERDRLAEAGRLFSSLIKQVRERIDQHTMIRKSTEREPDEWLDPEMRDELLRRTDQGNRDELLVYHRMACAAGRQYAADRIERLIVHAHDDSVTRRALVHQALEARQAGQRHVRLAINALATAKDEAGKARAKELIERLDVALDDWESTRMRAR